MAKGQQRSNKEVRKPKQKKVPAKAEGTFANQIKNAVSTNTPGAKGKN